MEIAADRSLHALADENIPFAREALATVVGGPQGGVERVPGRPLQPADAARADVLWVRSVTPVGPALLAEAQRLQFVGSATAGTDHVDRAFLRERGIAFAHAPGSNASSVADYVVAALLAVAARHEESHRGGRDARPLRGKTAAVVGCGAVGSRVARRLEALGLRVLRNDPPLAEVAEVADREGRSHDFRRLEAVLAAADVVTLHTPLTREGPHPSFHLMDEDRLAALPPGAWLVNTARGAVMDGGALGAALEAGHVGAAVLDVWPGEPTPDPALAALADVATPHIAGYAFDGKVRGTEMLYRALCEYLGVAPRWYAEDVLAAGDDTFQLNAPDPSLSETAWLDALTRQMYDVRADDRRLRAALEKPAGERGAAFTALRREYPRRRAFSRYRLAGDRVPPARREAVEEGLGIRVM
jgi:erythronate-4-phosphate dehydrogenase